jgi:predicted DNA-binding transcriptional regulator YafY
VRRTQRLFAITEYLRGRRTGVTAAELAERFDVTVRTMFRDLEALRDASLPINSERGRGGGFALDRAYSLPPVNFSAREAALLIAAGRWLAEMRVLPFTETLGTALDKVRAALTASSQRQLIEHLATLKFIGVPARTASPAVRRAIERAWFENAPLTIRYAGYEATTTRRVQIRSVVMERSETLLNCFDLDKQAERQFKLDKIEHAEVIAHAVTPPPDTPA